MADHDLIAGDSSVGVWVRLASRWAVSLSGNDCGQVQSINQ